MLGTSLAVQWLRLCTPNAGGMGSIPGPRTKILHAAGHGQQKKKKKKKFPMLIFLSVKLSRADCWCFADITLHQHEAWSGYESECHVKLMTEAAAGKQKGKVWAIDHLQQLERENESPSSPWNTIFFPSTGSLVQVCKTTGRCKAKPERDKGCVDQKLQK